MRLKQFKIKLKPMCTLWVGLHTNILYKLLLKSTRHSVIPPSSRGIEILGNLDSGEGSKIFDDSGGIHFSGSVKFSGEGSLKTEIIHRLNINISTIY